MLTTVEGVYSSGRIELLEIPKEMREGRVLAVDENRFTRPGPRVAEAAAELNAILDGLEYR